MTAAAPSPYDRVHMVGIGGSGMSGIAEVLVQRGLSVSGSDIAESAAVRHLREVGARVELGHCAGHLQTPDVVVKSSAIAADNPEIVAAIQRGVPVVERAELLADLMRARWGIAVAGSHGKTTTTSLIVDIFTAAGLNPGHVIGGVPQGRGHGAALGEAPWFIVEADESDASFLHLAPAMVVITNIDRDHLETYDHDLGRLQAVFADFVHRLPFWGRAVMCSDHEVVRQLAAEVRRPVVTYGLQGQPLVHGEIVARYPGGTRLRVRSALAAETFEVDVNAPGDHNALNALGATAVALVHDVSRAAIAQGLGEFAGVERRFEITEKVPLGGVTVTLVDDYGHHPTELAAVLATARQQFPEARLVVGFQPHRFSRTRDLFDDFVAVLGGADQLLLTNVYPAGEQPIAGADAQTLANAVGATGAADWVGGIESLRSALEQTVQSGDVVLLLGAGSIGRIAAELRQLA